jgi:hypothetical protein
VLETVSLPAAVTVGNAAFYRCTALVSANLPAVTVIGQQAFYNCSAFASLTLGTALPTLGSPFYVFSNAGKNTAAGLTIYVPMAQAKIALEAAIDDTDNNWYKALKGTSISGSDQGWFNGVAVKR